MSDKKPSYLFRAIGSFLGAGGWAAVCYFWGRGHWVGFLLMALAVYCVFLGCIELGKHVTANRG